MRLGHPAWLALAAASLAFRAAADPPPKLPVSAFFENPAVSGPRLSGDGKTVAVILSRGDLRVIATRLVAGKDVTPLAKFDDPELRPAWLEWANANRLLISMQARNPNSVGVRSRTTRLFGVDRDGKNVRWLGRKWPVYGQLRLPVTYQDQIVHWTPDEPDSVLVEFRPPYEHDPRVMRMNVDTGALALVQDDAHGIDEWYADNHGRIRAGVAQTENRYELWARIDPEGTFEKVLEHDHFGKGGPTFAGFHADPGKLYVYSGRKGRSALFEFDLAKHARGALVFSHPDVDVDGVKRDPGPERRVVGVQYTVDRPEIDFIEEAAERENRALRSALEGQLKTPVFHETVSASDDGVQQILEVSSDVQPPVYYFYDRQKKQLSRLLDQRPELKPEYLAPTHAVTYAARDGMTIPAYLTVPRGVEPKHLPLVALIHGGPWTRDSIQWDPEVQLLANRGFAVFQMNFRGSSGLGRRHLRAGYREWGQKIQDDITDGVKWLIAEGIADPDRIGITGGSYGGYATLVGLVKTPELYRAGAAYAPVTDIEFLLSDDKWYEWDYEWHETMVGGERGDKQRLRESSPLRRAAEIRVPVLLGHGEDDQRVHVRQSRRMAEALRGAGKQVEYMEFPDEIHGFLLEANRIKWYERLAAFFEENLAPRPKEAAHGG